MKTINRWLLITTMTDFRVKHHPIDYKYELSREDRSVWAHRQIPARNLSVAVWAHRQIHLESISVLVWAHRQIPAWNLSSYQSRIFNQVYESSLCPTTEFTHEMHLLNWVPVSSCRVTASSISSSSSKIFGNLTNYTRGIFVGTTYAIQLREIPKSTLEISTQSYRIFQVRKRVHSLPHTFQSFSFPLFSLT